MNPVYEEMFGQSREVLLNDRTKRIDLVHPDDREEATSGLAEAPGWGRPSSAHYRIIRPTDGETRWIRDIGFPDSQ